MPFFSLLLLILLGIISKVQKTIVLEVAANYVGDSVQFTGMVYDVKCLQDIKGLTTFVNLGQSNPNQLLTIVILQETRSKMKIEPTEKNLKWQNMHITGTIELY